MSTTQAIVIEEPKRLALQSLEIATPAPDDVVVRIDFSGVSTGTERLLWNGAMPAFPGMGYPLVPGYESVGRVVEAASPENQKMVGQTVFVPGARCYGEVKGLFGGQASRVVVPAASVVPIDSAWGDRGTLIALAATARHALAGGPCRFPDLIVGHGVLGRLLARLTLAAGGPPPVVWEIDPNRRGGADGYEAVHPDGDDRRDYQAIFDVSGDSRLLDKLISRLAPGGEIVLAGFYAGRLSFAFPPAFMKEARFRVAAQWKPDDLAAVVDLVETGQLSLEGLITHRLSPQQADQAYDTAFNEPTCTKMILDWREMS